MFVGRIESSAETIGQLVDRRRAHVAQTALGLPDDQREVFLAKHGLLSFDDFFRVTSLIESRKIGTGRAVDQIYDPATRGFLTRYNSRLHTANVDGWVQYLCDVAPQFAEVLSQLGNTLLPEPERRMHTLITAAAGWGKSELMKALVYHYVKHDTAAVVVLDPHGDMAPQIAKWPEFRGTDRLVYIEPGLEPDKTAGINPLDARGLDEHGIAVFGDQLGIAIGELSSDLTGNMEMVARGCARLLLEDGNATFFDLLDLLENPPKRDGEETPMQKNRARLIAKGREHPDRIMQRFFQGRIEASTLSSAREGIDNRISRLLFLPRFQHMTCGPSKLNLKDALDQRKVIVCNLAPLGSSGAAAMGRLIVALVAAIGLRREGSAVASRVPCHLFVDEAQTMASPSMARILFECRKFGIHLTLAQQAEGIGFDDVGQTAIAKSIGTKFVGANLPAALKGVFDGREIPAGAALKRRQFWMRWGQNAEPTRIEVHSELVDDTHAITAREWEAVKRDQVARYYRDAKAPMPAAPSPATAPAATRQPQRLPKI